MLAGDGFRGVEFEGLVDLRVAAFLDPRPCRGGGDIARAARFAARPDRQQAFGAGHDATCGGKATRAVRGELRPGGGRAAEVRRVRAVDGRADRRPAVAPRVDRHRAPALHVEQRAAWPSAICRPAAARPRLRDAVVSAVGLRGRPVRLALTAEVRQLESGSCAVRHPAVGACRNNGTSIGPPARSTPTCGLAFDGQTWRPEVTVRCLNVSFKHFKFPYRLEQGKGTLELKNDLLKLKLTAYSGSQPVQLAAEVRSPFSGPTGWFEADGRRHPIRRAAAGGPAGKAARSGPLARSPRHGRALRADVARQGRGADAPASAAGREPLLDLLRASFPYPLSEHPRRLEMIDGVVDVARPRGEQRHGPGSCEGSLCPGLQGNELVLNLVGKDVPLSEELRDAPEPAHPAGLGRPAAARRDRSDGRGPLLAGAEEVQRRRAGRAATRERVDRAGAISLPHRPASGRAPLSRRNVAFRVDQVQGRARRGQISATRALRFLARRAAGPCTSTTVGRSAPRRPRPGPCPAGAAEEGGRRAQSHRLDQSPRQFRPGADRPAGRAAAIEVERAAGAAAEPASSCGGLPLENVCTAKCRLRANSTGSTCSRRGELALDSLELQGLPAHPGAGTDLDRRRPGAVRLVGRSAGRRRPGHRGHRSARSRRAR